MNEEVHKDAFRGLLWELADDFSRKCTEALVTVYWSALNGLEWDDFERAVKRAREFSGAFPRPIDLRRLAEEGQETEAQRARRKEREATDREIEDWVKDRPRVERDHARFKRLMQHGAGDHRGQFLPECDGCVFDRAHPAAILHVRGRQNIVAADVDWSVPVAGCCEGAPR